MTYLSIVIPAYNEESMIQQAGEALDKVLSSAGINYQILFVDDGSSDYTWGDDIPDTVSPKVSILKKEYPYLKEADAQGLSNSVMDFLSAWKRFLKQPSHRSYTKRALRRDSSGTEPLSFRGLKGIPKFHAKAQGYSSYRTACQYPSGKNGLKQPTVRLEKDTLYLPKLKGG